MLQAKNNLEGAIPEYEAAVRLRPDDATGNNALGAALVAAGHPEQAADYLRAALKARPDYFDAHYNLGFALAGQNDFCGSGGTVQHGAEVAAQTMRPSEANLGAALAEMGRLPEAKSHFEHALQLDPNQPIAKENLEVVKKEMNAQ